MIVETYEIEEYTSSEASTMAADAESIDIATRLGLTGQLSLSDGDTLTRQPYGLMTAEQAYVYEHHCPVKTKLEEYTASIIPLRVLQVAALCREQDFFKSLYVWHPKVVTSDPVLVGYTKDNYYSGEPYLLARWGATLDSYPKLLAAAKAAFAVRFRAAVLAVKQEAEHALVNITQETEVRFLDNRFNLPSTFNL